MAERGGLLASVRVRTTAAAVLVVAIAMFLGAAVLVLLVRDSLGDGVETTAEQQADSLVRQIERSGLPGLGSPGSPESTESPESPDDAEEPEELLWQVFDGAGRLVLGSQPLAAPLDQRADRLRPAGAEHDYLVVTEDAEAPGGGEYRVVVAASLEEVDESIAALLGPLAIGLPLLLLVVGTTTWLVTGRALAPVERIRREVDRITSDQLDRRVPEPASRDEIHRLATTMNRMLARLEDSRDRQRRFVGDASHELRSPLAAIRQTAEVAQRHPGAMPEGELAEAVLEEALRMQHLVEQMLVLTRTETAPDAAGRDEVALHDVVGREVGAPARRRTDVRVRATGVDEVRVSGDPVALAQVVRNLLDNAIRHARSSVTLTLHAVDAGAELHVEDDGSGVDPVDRERVFDRFVRLDEARTRDEGGSGLGLAIVREIVAAHGGTVAFGESALGGARVVVRLPAKPEHRRS